MPSSATQRPQLTVLQPPEHADLAYHNNGNAMLLISFIVVSEMSPTLLKKSSTLPMVLNHKLQMYEPEGNSNLMYVPK
jgi:hypothetical protein